jgi:peptidoglycan/LPS O-acetylase OafA/YrhL
MTRGRHDNNFDLLRILAATQVLGFHLVGHFGLDVGYLHILEAMPGVPIFFVISGYLVSDSLERSKSIGQYFRARATQAIAEGRPVPTPQISTSV